MFYIKDGWEEDPRITEEQAQKLLTAMFPHATLKKKPSSPSVGATHIGGYIEHMMYEENYSSISITISKDKDEENHLIFTIHNKER